MKLLDTNMILRFLLDDNADMNRIGCLLIAYHSEQGYEICTFDKN